MTTMASVKTCCSKCLEVLVCLFQIAAGLCCIIHCNYCCTKQRVFQFLFFLINLFTCQWIRPKRKGEKCCWDRTSVDSKKACSCFTTFCGCVMIGMSFLAMLINMFPLAMFIAGWSTCQNGSAYKISELCYTLHFDYAHSTNNNEFPELVLREYKPENDVNNSDTKHLIQEFVDLSKISLLFSTTANAVSHVLFIWALWCLFWKHYESVNKECLLRSHNFIKRLSCAAGTEDEFPLDPFNDEIEEGDLMEINTAKQVKELYEKKNANRFFSKEVERTNTPLQGERLCHYVTWFIIGIILYIITVGVFFHLYYEQNKHRSINKEFKLEISALVLYAYSLFQVLVSCFIFSKLMYGIQRRCEELELFVYHINEEYRDENHYIETHTEDTEEQEDNTHTCSTQTEIKMQNMGDDLDKIAKDKENLKECDRHFIDTAVSTLSWLQLWFLLHWILHIISTFMIMSLLIDAIALHVKSRISHIEHGVGFHPGEIGFLFMFSVLHCFFLFYPCLRAASVTRTRQRVIRKISEKASNEYKYIPNKVMQEFIESMKRRKFSFRLRILCARIPFNLNIAYVSIAFGFVGVIVSLITTVTK
ncbi:PREDICTED: uncharacterized protein LOC109588134 [Amphimedon queenslandica]|uniref:Uncharacterized protein n=3 Tax=Amphimedon queenslandica TaxID=400682 RepID=A0AAN0JSS5_AMPQE|nr:PREDICTED: uncharacterized protein LOC109588134 [Amphimedon queenslandica]|eukprot:XP_019859876.1 PREDICTED: uncharacterized protein LOC109588134 [Amphimedon queenslandica]